MQFSFQNAGFTLVELIITLAIIAIVTAFAAPAFGPMIERNRITQETNRILASIQLARSEAVKRNSVVNLARTSAANFTWEDGWRLYSDASGEANGSDFDAANDANIRQYDASDTGITIRTNAVANARLSFSGNGMLNMATAAEIYICSQNDSSTGRRINVNRGGQATSADIPDGDDCAP